jgi:glycosyltransferase involved in cell wall biosynthesis
MPDAALIIASPWPRTGSANLFAAHSLFLSKRGYRTAMLLSPHLPEHRLRFVKFWASTLDAMQYDGLDLLCKADTRRRTRRWRSRSFFQWQQYGQDSQLAIMARYAAAARLPPELISFLDANDLRLIVVNHCFQMQVAENICNYLQRKRRQRPLVVLEAHDVQAKLYASSIDNVFRSRPDPLDLLVQDELRLMSAADVVAHVTAEDLHHFEARLRTRHRLVLATLDPARESKLLELDGFPGTSNDQPIDFLYIGNNNPGNERSILWFLNEVVPLLDDRYSVTIVGGIARHLKKTRRALFDRFERYFVGEVDDVVNYYQRSAVVFIPTTFGTGTSIKAIEALAAGKPVVATAAAMRGFPGDAVSAAVHIANDDPAVFAASMVDLHRRRHELGRESRKLYLDHFSNARYFERWDRLLSG